MTDKTLIGHVALVAGGAGDVGEGIVAAYLEQGATVVVPSRTQSKLNALRSAVSGADTGSLHLILADVGTDAGAQFVREELLAKYARLDSVVASLGSWWQGKPLVDITSDIWARLIQGNFVSHLTVAHTFLPLLSAAGRGAYLLINGGASLQPIPNAGPMSILSAAQTMVARVLMAENKGSGLRINQLLLQSPVQTRARPTLNPDWITAEEVGRVATWLASEAGAMVSGSILPLGDRPPLVSTAAQRS